MSWDSDTSTDHAYLDGVVGVTYTTPAGTQVTSLKGIPSSIRVSDIQGNPNLGITNKDRICHVFEDAQFASNPLEPQGQIRYGGVDYTILSADFLENAQQYRCLLRRRR